MTLNLRPETLNLMTCTLVNQNSGHAILDELEGQEAETTFQKPSNLK